MEATPEGLAAVSPVPVGSGCGKRRSCAHWSRARSSHADLAATAGSDRATLRRLEARGLIATRELERRRRHDSPGVGVVREGVELTPDQRAVLGPVVGSLPARGGSAGASYLLHGVTGSGKTEVYLEASRETLARGRGAIVLVPEIALTPQTMDRFRRRFGDSVALLHSRMAAGARYDEWRRLRSGEARICVGPRSAVFAPVIDLA